MLELGIRSKFAIVRQCSTKCFATVCDVITNDAMRYVVEKAIPLMNDPLNLNNRQGSIELIFRKDASFVWPLPMLTAF